MADGERKKKIKPGNVELHPEELALIVPYEVSPSRASSTRQQGLSMFLGPPSPVLRRSRRWPSGQTVHSKS
jgi:hypothetical protein